MRIVASLGFISLMLISSLHADYSFSYCLKFYSRASQSIGKYRAVFLNAKKLPKLDANTFKAGDKIPALIVRKGKKIVLKNEAGELVSFTAKKRDVTKTYALLFSKEEIEDKAVLKKVIKKDLFIGLYLLDLKGRYKKSQSYDLLNLNDFILGQDIAGVTLGHMDSGRILKRQKGYIDYANFSGRVGVNGVVSDICYQIYGLGTGGAAFIEKPYIDRFISMKDAYYGDIGIRVSSSLKVLSVDPFFKDNPFKLGDKILRINGHTFINHADYEWYVSNLPRGKLATVVIDRLVDEKIKLTKKQERDKKMGKDLNLPPPKQIKKTIRYKIMVRKRYGGFYLPDTFFDRFGIVFNKEFVITKIKKDMKYDKTPLRVGDQLLWLNNIPIKRGNVGAKSFANLRLALSKSSNNIDMVIMRNGLQFHLVFKGVKKE